MNAAKLDFLWPSPNRQISHTLLILDLRLGGKIVEQKKQIWNFEKLYSMLLWLLCCPQILVTFFGGCGKLVILPEFIDRL